MAAENLLTLVIPMHGVLVALQVLLAGKRRVTNAALERQIVLRRQMPDHRGLRVKLLLAVRTVVPVLSVVMEHVVLQLDPLDKRHAALVAFVRLVARVRLDMSVQRLLGRKPEATLQSELAVLVK